MVSRSQPDRYANTGFAVKDTAPEINAMISAAMMHKTPEGPQLMGFDRMTTARELVWDGIGNDGTDGERRNRFFQRFHGLAWPR